VNGKIKGLTLQEVAEFLKEFTGAAATFEVHRMGDETFTIEFTGGF